MERSLLCDPLADLSWQMADFSPLPDLSPLADLSPLPDLSWQISWRPFEATSVTHPLIS